MGTIKTAQDLDVYRLAHELAMQIFCLTKEFPKEETYSLIDQIRRSSRSVAVNIAEGWGKRQYVNVFKRHLTDSTGSVEETKSWLQFSLRCGYVSQDLHDTLLKKYEELSTEFKFRNTVADVVQNIPSRSLKQKYDVLNILFIVFLSLVTVPYLLFEPPGALWLIWLIYVVSAREFRFYYWITLLGAIGIIGSIVILLYDIFYSGKVPFFVPGILAGFSLIFLLFGIIMPKLMTPAYSIRKEFYTNANGQKKVMVRHIFKG